MSKLLELIQADPVTRARKLAATEADPQTFSEQERRQAAELLHDIAQLRTTPADQLAPALRLAFLETPVGISGFPVPPLPSELQTRGRLMHDEMHSLLLNSHPQLLIYQLAIDELLRKNQEFYPPFELLTLLNDISQHLTGKHRFLEAPAYTYTQEQQDTNLKSLHTRKPEIHARLVTKLVNVALYQHAPHNADCTCPLCAHIKSLNSPGLAESLERLQRGRRSSTPQPEAPSRCTIQ